MAVSVELGQQPVGLRSVEIRKTLTADRTGDRHLQPSLYAETVEVVPLIARQGYYPVLGGIGQEADTALVLPLHIGGTKFLRLQHPNKLG